MHFVAAHVCYVANLCGILRIHVCSGSLHGSNIIKSFMMTNSSHGRVIGMEADKLKVVPYIFLCIYVHINILFFQCDDGNKICQ